MTTDYTLDVQKLFLQILLSVPELYVRVGNIFNPQNFDKSLREPAEFLQEYVNQYTVIPEVTVFNSVLSTDFTIISDLNEKNQKWFLDEFEGFTKRRELERAILKSADLLEKGEFGPVEKMIKDAVQITLQKDLGTDYFQDPRSRLMTIKSKNGQVSTGWKSLDSKLFGGMSRGELNVFAGGSGSGKSLFMQNLAVNWALAGLNGVYISLELSEELCSMRIDSMFSGVSSKNIFREIDKVELKVKMIGKKSGKLRIKYLPAQSNINDIRSYCKELEIQTGIKVDFICIDYLDLLMPISVKVSPSDLFVKDKYVSEEIRNLAKELNVLLVTASQLNRNSVDEIEFDHSHISGGISKINTSDNVFGIFTSRHMREQGRYQLQMMKTRSSNAVGQKIELNFDVETLRITDSGEEETSEPNSPTYQSPRELLDKLKTNPIPEPTEKTVHASAESKKLNALLNSLRPNK